MRRTLTKTATYSAMHMTVAIGVAYALSGNWAIALGIGLIEPLVQTVAYHIHEKAWDGRGDAQGACPDTRSHHDARDISGPGRTLPV